MFVELIATLLYLYFRCGREV